MKNVITCLLLAAIFVAVILSLPGESKATVYDKATNVPRDSTEHTGIVKGIDTSLEGISRYIIGSTSEGTGWDVSAFSADPLENGEFVTYKTMFYVSSSIGLSNDICVVVRKK
jgi:hypothetical protein